MESECPQTVADAEECEGKSFEQMSSERPTKEAEEVWEAISAPNEELLGPKDPRKIGDWNENQELGTWIYKSDEIEIHLSMWQHLDFNHSYTLCVRWEYQLNNFATYIKVQEEDGDIEKLLMHGAGFVTNWLAERKEADGDKDSAGS